MQIIFQMLSATVTILAILQKQKWKMMMFYTFNNLISIAMYLAFARTTTAIIYAVAAFRTIVFMIYSFKKIKPNFIWLMIFEAGFLIATILTWNDALDLLPLFAMLFAGYGSWQDNQTVLRITYILNQSLYVIYKTIIGAYISMSVDAASLICTIICLVYYCILRKETSILSLIFKRKKQNIENQHNEHNNEIITNDAQQEKQPLNQEN